MTATALGAPDPDDYLTNQQIDVLLSGIKGRRVGKDAKGFSHVEAYDIRAHLNRLFGFARWSADILTMELVSVRDAKTKAGKDAVEVIYRAQCRLKVNAADGTELASYTEWACGDSLQPSLADAHDQALKTAESQALKRAATNLGDQFGLSLYNKGQLEPIVGVTIVRPAVPTSEAEASEDVPDLTEHIKVPLAREVGEEDAQRETSTQPADGPHPTSPGADGPAGEAPAAQELIQNRFPGAEPDHLAEVLALMARARDEHPAEAMQTLNSAMELAVRKQLRTRKIPGGNETLGAGLARLMAQCSKAQQQARSQGEVA